MWKYSLDLGVMEIIRWLISEGGGDDCIDNFDDEVDLFSVNYCCNWNEREREIDEEEE